MSTCIDFVTNSFMVNKSQQAPMTPVLALSHWEQVAHHTCSIGAFLSYLIYPCPSFFSDFPSTCIHISGENFLGVNRGVWFVLLSPRVPSSFHFIFIPLVSPSFLKKTREMFHAISLISKSCPSFYLRLKRVFKDVYKKLVYETFSVCL